VEIKGTILQLILLESYVESSNIAIEICRVISVKVQLCDCLKSLELYVERYNFAINIVGIIRGK